MNFADSQFQSIFQDFLDTLIDPYLWLNILQKAIIIVLIWIGVRIAIRMGRALVDRILVIKEGSRIRLDERRINTLRMLLRNVINYSFSFLGILLILAQFIDIMPILAGAGVLGLAVAFGAQNLVRDVITGFFIIFEDQFAVGDVIRTGNYEGTVHEIGLRVTKIKSPTGEIHIIPNGAITEVTNFSTSNSVAVLDISIAYEEDIPHVISVLEKKMAEVYEQGIFPELVQKPEVLGVQNLGPSEVVIRITAECMSMTHFKVRRGLITIIKETLEQDGIEIPYPRVVNIQRGEKRS
jgi:small-conductance mechanosensitive channel